MSDSKTTNQKEEEKVDVLDSKIKDIFIIGSEIQDIVSSGKRQQPHWSVCLNKLQSCYSEVDDSEGFRDMFIKFHEKYSKEYAPPIFTSEEEDDRVNDEFFASEKVFETPGRDNKKNNEKKEESKRKGAGAFRKPILKGPVIYFDYSDEKASNICIPIGEIYRTTLNLYEEMEKEGRDDADTRSLPSRLLLAFYEVIVTACGEDCSYYKKLNDNITMLKETVSNVTVDGTASNSKSSGPFGVLKDIFKKVIPSLSKDGKGMPKELENTLGKVLKDDTLDDIGGIFSEFGNTIEKGAAKAAEAKKEKGSTASVATMLDSISDALKTESIVTKMENIAGKLGQLTGNGELAPPTAKVEQPIESADACEQD